jgi:hypothetical protein
VGFQQILNVVQESCLLEGGQQEVLAFSAHHGGLLEEACLAFHLPDVECHQE